MKDVLFITSTMWSYRTTSCMKRITPFTKQPLHSKLVSDISQLLHKQQTTHARTLIILQGLLSSIHQQQLSARDL